MTGTLAFQVFGTENTRGVSAWAQLVATGAAQAAPPQVGIGILGAVRIRVVFVLPRPNSLEGLKHRNVQHLSTPDLLVLTRAVVEAMINVVYADDSQVVDTHAVKRYTDIDERPHVALEIDELTSVQDLPLFGRM